MRRARSRDGWREHRRPLGEILEHGTWLDREDVDALLTCRFPGIDELIGMLEIDRLARQSRLAAVRTYDRRRHRADRPHAAAAGGARDRRRGRRGARRAAAAAPADSRAAGARRAAGGRRSPDRAAGRAGARDGGAPARPATDTRSLGDAAGGAVAGRDRDGIAALERAGITVARDRRQPRAAGRRPVSDLRSPSRRASAKVIAAIRRRFGARPHGPHSCPRRCKEPRGVKALASLARAGAGKGSGAQGAARPSAVGRKPIGQLSSQPLGRSTARRP